MLASSVETPRLDLAVLKRMDAVEKAIASIAERLDGDPARRQLDQSDTPSVADRVGRTTSSWQTRQLPTGTQVRDAELAAELKAIITGELAALHQALSAAGAPRVRGRPLDPPC